MGCETYGSFVTRINSMGVGVGSVVSGDAGSSYKKGFK